MPTVDGDALFRANLNALRQSDPELAARVEGIPFPKDAWVPARRGSGTLRVRGEDGAERLLHSRVDPAAEAKAQIAAVPRSGVSAYLVYGLGAGHHLALLLSEAPDACQVVVLERSAECLRAALAVHDWSAPLRAGRLHFLVDLDRPAAVARLGRLTLSLFAGTEAVRHPPSLAAFPSFYRQAMETVSEFFAFATMNLKTLATLTQTTFLNVCMNLPAYATGEGVAGLAGAAKGRPAILVSAGPSLARNVHLLEKASRGAVVISVPTVFRMLLSRGIVPDFVTSLDHHKISAKYFEGLEEAPPVTLVCDPKVSYAVVDTYPGPKRFTAHPFLSEVLGPAFPEKGTIRWGATVAHLSLYLAEHLGADPVILVGQDLCHPYGITHMPGSSIHENWMPELNRFSTFEMKEWETILRIRPILRRAKDVHGHDVYTDEQMFSYLLRFEEDFARSPSRIIDATEGGLPKKGADRMTLAEAVDRYCGEPIDRERLRPPARDEAERERLRSGAMERVEAWGRRISEAQAYYREMGDRLARVRDRIGRGESPAAAIQEVRAEAERIGSFLDAHRLVSGLAQADEFRRVKADFLLQTVRSAGKERQRQELERDLDYMQGLARAAETLQAFLKVSRERLEGTAVRARAES